MLKTFTEIRKEKGLTIENLAKLVGTTHASMWAYEARTIVPRFDTAIKIAEILEISIEDLAQSLDVMKIKGSKKVSKTHRCHAIGCCREISIEEIMCPAHWELVPQGLKQSIKQKLKRQATPSLHAAIDRAIITVAQATVI